MAKGVSPVDTTKVPLIVESLAAVCRANPLAEKIFVAASFQVGRMVREALSLAIGGCLNLRVTTPIATAKEVVAVLAAERGLLYSDEASLDAVLGEAYRSLPSKRFLPVDPGPGLHTALRNLFGEIRLAGLGPSALKPLPASTPGKLEDLSSLLTGYQEILACRSLLDDAGLFEIASGMVAPAGAIVLIPESLRLPVVARKFLEEYKGAAKVVLLEDPVIGLDGAGQRWAQCEAKPVSTLSHFFALDPKCPPVPSIDLFTAVGERNEVREAVRRIVAGKIPFEQVEIALPDYKTYAPIFDDLRSNVPGLQLTLGGGLPASRSRVARALSGFASFIREDFREPILRRMFASGDLSSPENVSGRMVARILREARIGQGRERFAERFDAVCNGLKLEIHDEEEEGRKESRTKKLETTLGVADLVGRIIALVPSEGSTLAAYLGCASGFLQDHVTRWPEREVAVAMELEANLASLGRYAERVVNRDEAADILLAISENVSIGSSSPMAGHIHVTDLFRAGFSSRPFNFILGLDESRFPGSLSPDPLLSDEERIQVSTELSTAVGRFRERAFRFAEYFARLRGSLTLGFPSFDLTDGRRRFPSPAFLQGYRMRTGKHEAGYEEMLAALGPPAGFLENGIPLSTDDAWLEALAEGKILLDGRDSVLRAFPLLNKGGQSLVARTADSAGEHDGRLSADAELDPRGSSRGVSASRLESYAACPRRYFYRYVLKIAPPDEVEYDPSMWLNPMERGSLLHDFYSRFLSTLKERGERRDPEKHTVEAEKMLDEVITDWKRENPPPSLNVFEREREELQQSLRVFLREEQERGSNAVPTWFEIPFGMGEEKEIGTADPVNIGLPGGGSVLVSGRIDRIDRAEDGGWEVWDYKTGSAYKYEESGYVAGGTQVQHVLYALAAESLLRKSIDKKAKVVRAGYLFPTQKGRGKTAIGRPVSKRVEGLKVIERILDGMADGMFVATGADCGYCDFAPICGSYGGARWEALNEAGDGAVRSFCKEVQDHE